LGRSVVNVSCTPWVLHQRLPKGLYSIGDIGGIDKTHRGGWDEEV